MSKVWTWAWRLGVGFFIGLTLFYAIRICVGLQQRDLYWLRATPTNASLVMRMGQYKPPALKPPFNTIILVAFPTLTLVGMGALAWSVRKVARHGRDSLA